VAGDRRPVTSEEKENAEYAEKRKSKSWLALERKSPPFAKGAKDGAPSSTYVLWIHRESAEKPGGTFCVGNAFLVIGPAFAATAGKRLGRTQSKGRRARAMKRAKEACAWLGLAGALLGVMLLAPTVVRADEVAKTFTVSGHARVRVQTDDGSVRVSTGDIKQVEIRVEYTGYKLDRDLQVSA
jgi:hypothetical protein